jgi:hypothetical protein
MKRFWLSGPVLVLLLFLGGGCQTSPPEEPAEEEAASWFRDVTGEVDLDFVHDPGARPRRDHFLPAIIGSGAAVLDFDRDGRLDLLLLQNAGPGSGVTHRLYRQLPGGRFADVSKGSGLDVDGYGMGVAVGDVNNDGWPDVLITDYGRIRLFLNNGNGTFTDVTKEAGLDNPRWGTSAAFFDYDRDGWLDLVVVNYLEYDPARRCIDNAGRADFCNPSGFSGVATRLYRNLGRSPGAPANVVRFEDVTSRSGLGAVKGPGLGVVCADFNGDGWPDIFVANDGKPNHLWINQKTGAFKEQAVLYGVATNAVGAPQGNMGVAIGDLDGDGLFDLFITHLPDELNVCWKQGPRGFFQDQTGAMGLASPRWRGTGFGAAFGDFDHDGALDVAVVNGAVRLPPRLPPGFEHSFWGRYAERNQLFANDGRGRFRDVSEDNRAFCGTAAVARALVCADIDGDGALDLLVTAVAGPARLHRNVAARRGHWLMVRARLGKEHGRRDAYGAEVAVRAGKRTWKAWLNPGYSYLSSNDPRVHFGLGTVERVDAIEVLWPDGVRESFAGRPADRVVVLDKGAGRRIEGGAP